MATLRMVHNYLDHIYVIHGINVISTQRSLLGCKVSSFVELLRIHLLTSS